MSAAIIFTKAVGGVSKSGFKGGDFVLLGIDRFIEDFVASGSSCYGFILFVELARYQLHFATQYFERLVYISQCAFKLLFALDAYFQPEVISHLKHLLPQKN